MQMEKESAPPPEIPGQDHLLSQIEEQQQEIHELNTALTAKTKDVSQLETELATKNKYIADHVMRTPPANVVPVQTRVEVNTPQSLGDHSREATPFTNRTDHGTTVSATGRSAKLADAPRFWNVKSKDEMSFTAWYRAVVNKLEANADHYPTDKLRRIYIEGRLAGPASENLQPYLQEDHPNPITTSEELLKHLKNEYMDPNDKEQAIIDYNKLKLEEGGNVNVFKNKFVRLAGEIRKPKSEWKSEFRRKLTLYLRTQLVGAFVDPKVDFEQYARMAAEVDLDYRQAQKESNASTGRGGGSGRGGSRGGFRGGRGGYSSRSATPATTATAQLDRPSPEEAKKLALEGRCFLCKEKGHLARQCTKSPRAISAVENDTARHVPDINAVLDYHFGKIPAEKRVEEVDDSEN
jgi:uncharacterized membrane protein YgcG